MVDTAFLDDDVEEFEDHQRHVLLASEHQIYELLPDSQCLAAWERESFELVRLELSEVNILLFRLFLQVAGFVEQLVDEVVSFVAIGNSRVHEVLTRVDVWKRGVCLLLEY